MHIRKVLGLAAALHGFSMVAQASQVHVVGQKDKEFSVEAITIKVGDEIQFENQDPYFHNVFSLSDEAFFDLGSFPQGQSKTVKFEEAGEIHVECAIHPNMKLTVNVEG